MNILMRRNGMNKLEKQHVIKRENLNEEHYFEDILQQAGEMRLLNESELENIKLQCIQLLAKQTERYTGGESSSVTVEKAQSIMCSIFYCISVFLKSLPEPDMCIIELKKKPLYDLYKRGRKLIDTQIQYAQRLLKTARENRVNTDNIAYNDTIGEGMTSFFTSYDADFAAHDILPTIDYPLCNDKMNLKGIEYICSYLDKLIMENEFCQNYLYKDINCVLRGYNEYYSDLLINIFERVLINALGSILTDKSACQLDIKEKQRQHLQKKLDGKSEIQLEELLKAASEKLFTELSISNDELQQYILADLKAVSENLYNALKNHQLKAVFVSFKENNTETVLQFEDGEKMDDELFRKIADEIMECHSVSDKITLIKENIRSVVDLVDIFEAGCIFNDEFISVFESMGDMELTLLLSTMPSDESDYDELKEEWQQSLINFLNKLDSDRRRHISELCASIKVG